MRTSRVFPLLLLQACAGVTGLAYVISHPVAADTRHASEVLSKASAPDQPSLSAVRHGQQIAAAPANRAASVTGVRPRLVERRRLVLVHRQTATAPASRHPEPRRRPAPTGTTQQWLDAAIARTPGGGAGITWRLYASDGHWGTTDWYTNTVYISPRTPGDRTFDVVVHEWSHVQSVRAYGGNVDQAVRDLKRWFGGSGLLGAERAADCMARLQGATWTYYTPCTDGHWRDGARRLLAGQHL